MAKPANRTDVPTPTIDGTGQRVALVVARFNDLVTDRLRQGARDALRAAGVADEDIEDFWIPGAFELPQACLWAAESGRFDAVVALGAVIRGGTDHYEHVCTQASRGVIEAQLQTGVPIGFGLLTCSEFDQALARAGGADAASGDDRLPGESSNKGADAALAALEMLAVRDTLGG